jgi:hypothetical protein
MSSFKKMKRLTASRLVVAMVMSIATAAVVGGGISAASIPDGSGVIHGCYNTSGTNHTLKVIDSAVTSKCPTGYKSLNWNQTGPQGEPGPTGPAGTARDVGSVTSVGQGGPSFYSEGLKGWVSVTSPSTGLYCLTPDASSTEANSTLVVSNGSPGGFSLGAEVYWDGYCSESSPLEYRVLTYVNTTLNNDVPFTAIVP